MPSWLRLALEWTALAMPLALLCVVMAAAGARRFQSLWALAAVIMLVGFIGELLFRVSLGLGYAPDIVKSTASPVGIVVSLLWIGWGSLYNNDTKRPRRGLALRVALTLAGVASIAMLIVFFTYRQAPVLYSLIVAALQICIFSGNAMVLRRSPRFFIIPFACFGLEYIARMMSAALGSIWLPREAGFLFSILGFAFMAATVIADPEPKP